MRGHAALRVAVNPIQWEKTKLGYVLHITGRRATDAVVGEVMEEIERMFEEG